MKFSSRFTAFTLVLIMLLSSCNVLALAEAVLTMPAALKIIDEEAFYGSTSIDKVVLPEGVTEIHSKAFANSTLSEINLPNSLTFIADDAFDGPDKVTVTANPGTVAYDWAVRNLYINDKLTIKSVSCNTESANIGDVVTWSVIVNGGTNEYNYQYTVYNGKSIVMTSSYTEDASFSYSPTAEGQYSIRVTVDDGEDSVSKKTDSTVNVSKAALKIDSIDISMGEAVTGELVYWTVKTSGGESGLTFDYILKKDGIQVDAVSNSKNNFYSSVLEEKGVYVLSATVKDRSNASASYTAEALTVGVQPVQIYSIELENASPIIEGEDLTWNVIAGQGTEPYTFIYTILIDGVENEAIASQNNSYTYENAQGNHTYAVKVVCRDKNGVEAERESSALQVIPVIEILEDVPSVRFPGLGLTIPEAKESAPEIEPQDILLEWDSNAENEYTIILSKEQNGAWQEVMRADTNDQNYLINSSKFNQIETTTLYCVKFQNSHLWQGAARSYYFYVKPVSTSITINGKTDIIWHQASKLGSNRAFVVESDLPWDVSANEPWVNIFTNEGGFNISFSTFENNFALHQERTADITVTNGKATATIHLMQYDGDAAFIESPIWSQDPANPSIISPGGVFMDLNVNPSKTQLVVIYEKLSSGNYTEVYRSDTGKTGITLLETQTSLFKNNTDYKISVLSVYDKNYRLYEIEDDILTEDYYVKTSGNASSIKVNGKSELVTSIVSNISVSVDANAFYYCTTDASWLTTSREDESHTEKGTVRLTAEANYTSSTRVGHVYFHSGVAIATVTVNQESSLPELIYPAGISESANSPTTIPFGYIRYTAKCDEIQWFVYNNGSYEGINEGFVTSDPEMRLYTAVADTDLLVAGAKYRITVKSGTHEKNYYIKLGTSTVDNIVTVDGDSKTQVWTLPSTSFSKTVAVKGEANWTAKSSASWLKLSATSGTTTKKNITITATANTTDAERYATISFSCGGIDVTHIEVTQTVSDYLEVYVKDNSADNHVLTADETLHLEGESTYIDLRPFSSADWNISSDVNWIRFNINTTGRTKFSNGSDSISGVASGKQVTVVLSENANGNSTRSGHVTITCGNCSYTFLVSQEPALIAPVLTTPSLSTSSNSPSVYVYGNGNINISWNSIQGASEYEITVESYNQFETVGRIIQSETGKSSYTATIMQEWLKPDEL